MKRKEHEDTPDEPEASGSRTKQSRNMPRHERRDGGASESEGEYGLNRRTDKFMDPFRLGARPETPNRNAGTERGSSISRPSSSSRPLPSPASQQPRPHIPGFGPATSTTPSSSGSSSTISTKHIIQRVAELTTRMNEVQPAIDALEKRADGHDLHEDTAVERLEQLEAQVEWLYGRTAELADSVKADVEKLQASVDELILKTAEKQEIKVTAKEKKKALDNAKAAVVRAVMRKCMGASEKGPELFPPPLEDAEFWDNSGEMRVLHPDWSRTWEENYAGWGEEVMKHIREQGWQWCPRLTKEQIAQLTEAGIVTSMKTYFQSSARAYKAFVATKTPEEMEERKKAQRHNSRRNEKSRARTDIRSLIPELADKSWDFCFHPGYQSSEDTEEEGEPNMDPDSPARGGRGRGRGRKRGGGSGKGRKTKKQGKALVSESSVMTRRQFKIRPPTYRSEELEETFRLIDTTVWNERKKRALQVQHNYVAHVVGEPKDVPLPLIREVALRAPRRLLDAGWLADNTEYDMPRYYACSDAEDDLGEEDVEGEPEDVQPLPQQKKGTRSSKGKERARASEGEGEADGEESDGEIEHLGGEDEGSGTE